MWVSFNVKLPTSFGTPESTCSASYHHNARFLNNFHHRIINTTFSSLLLLPDRESTVLSKPHLTPTSQRMKTQNFHTCPRASLDANFLACVTIVTAGCTPQPSVTAEGAEAETAQIVMAEVWSASQLLKWGSTFLCWTCSSLQWFCLKRCQRAMPLDACWTVAPPPESFPKQFKHHLPCCWLLLSGAFRVFNESSILLWIVLLSSRWGWTQL